MKNWSIKKSEELYNVRNWGKDYFKINQSGNISISTPEHSTEADLLEVINELTITDIQSPVLLRFPDIIDDRIRLISNSFKQAKKEFNYKSDAYTVYPIKVNQMEQVVEEISNSGAKYNIGLEAGSKPELHAVLAHSNDDTAPIICNGYKDEEFIELALLAKKMGKNIFLVVEKLNELKMIIKVSEKLKVRPNIGIRIRLNSSGSGKWEDSGGDKSKFGLSSSELLTAINIAKDYSYLECIKLIHFHLGSQITRIRKIKNALRESAQYYYELRKLGCGVEYIDVGGGLGVDYDGTSSTNTSSINYTVQEYVNDVVFAVVNISKKYNLPHPKIITESGRAVTAHHSVLIFDVLETMSAQTIPKDFKVESNDHENLRELFKIYKEINSKNMYEFWHDANQIREENNTLFSLSHLGLTTKATGEMIFFSIAEKFRELCLKYNIDSEEFTNASKLLADKYFCNFSLFQSVPDSWAISQIFPIMPIHRLNQYPERRATLQDITCDSDGRVTEFVVNDSIENFLPVHELQHDEKYYLGVFLVGAYQEILGDLHNLFGDTNAAHVRLTDEGYDIEQIIHGESVDEVLSYVGYNAKKLQKTMESWVAKAVKSKKVTTKEGKEFLNNYKTGLFGYTYLE